MELLCYTIGLILVVEDLMKTVDLALDWAEKLVRWFYIGLAFVIAGGVLLDPFITWIWRLF